MNLLLLLTALLASLTGSGSGDRHVRQLGGVAVVRTPAVAQAAVQPARAVNQVVKAALALRPEAAALRPATSAALAGQHFPFERRLE